LYILNISGEKMSIYEAQEAAQKNKDIEAYACDYA